MWGMNSRMGAACLVLLVLMACSSEPIEKDARYGGVMELRDAVVASKAIEEPDCDDAPTQEVQGLSAWEATTCGQKTVILVTQDEDLLDTRTDRDAQYLKYGHGILLGPNWSIRGPDIKKLRDALGGEIVQDSVR